LGQRSFHQGGALLQIAIELKHFPKGHKAAALAEAGCPALAERRGATVSGGPA